MKDSRFQIAALESPSTRGESGYYILLIEDHPDHQLLEQRALQGLGANTHVVVVTTALEGLAALQQHDFDLVIADYQMPGMNGLEFLRRLNDQQITVPVIIVTGLGNERVAVEALKRGAYDYVIKETGYLALLPSVAERAIAATQTKRQLEEARRRLAESEERYRVLVNSLDAILWEADPLTWQFTFVSQRAEKILGYPVEQWLTEPDFWAKILHPEDSRWALQYCKQAVAEKQDHEFEYRAIAADGRVVWLRDIVRVVCENGAVRGLRGLMVDVTKQKQAEEELKRLQRVAAQMASKLSLKELLQEIVCVVAEACGTGTNSILLVDAEAGELRLGASVGLPQEYVCAIARMPIGGPRGGCCGTAAERGEVVIIEDMRTHPLWQPYRELSERFGLRAVWTVPIVGRDGKVLATLATYYRDPYRPSPEQLELVKAYAQHAAVAIENARLYEQLARSEEKFAKAFRSSPDGITITALADGRLIDVNESFLERSGYRREEVLGRTTIELNIWADPEDRARMVQSLQEQGAIRNWECRLRTKSGETRVKLISAEIIELGGEPCILTIGRDITERKQIEQELRESEERYRTVTETATDAIMTIDEESRIIFVNRAAEKTFGYTQAEMLGQPLSLLIPEYRRLVHQADGRQCLETAEAAIGQETVELTGLHKSGREIPLEVSFGQLTKQGKPIVTAVIRDITERKRAEETLHQRLEQLQVIYRLSDVLSRAESVEDIYQEALDAVEQLCRTDRAALLTFDPDGVMRFKAWRGLSESYRRAVEGHSPWRRDEVNPQPILIADVEQAPSVASLRSVILGEGVHALGFIPITYQGRLLGKLMLYYNAPHRFGDEEVQMAQTVASHVAFAIDQKQVEAERQVISEIIQGVNVTANLDDLLHLIHQSLKKVIYAENCFVALYDRETGMFNFPFFVDKYDTVPSPQAVGRSCTAYVFRTGRPLLLTEDSFRELVQQGEVELVGTSSPVWLGVPLKTPSETIGVLVVQHYEDEHVYTERDLEFLSSVGGQIALAIERKRAEDALRENAMRLQALVGSIDEIVMEFDQEGTYLNIWTSDERLLVRPKAELLGHRAAEVLGEDFVGPFLEVYRRVLATGQAESAEYSLDVMRGRRWFLARISPIPSADGSYKTVCVLARDITERKQMEQALEEHNRQLNILYEQARREAQHSSSLVEVTSAINSTMQIDDLLDLIVEKVLALTNSKQGSLFLLDETGETLTPCAPRRLVQEQARGLRFKVGEGVAGWVAQTGQGVLLNDVTHHPKFKSTAPFWPLYSTIAVPMLIQERAVGVLCIDRFDGEAPFTEDEFRITQDFAKQAALALAKARLFEALRRSQQQYQSLVETSNDVIFSLDINGRITYVNPAIERASGYTPAEVIGKSFMEFIHPEDGEAVGQLFAQRLQGDTQVAEFRVVSKQGEVRFVQSSGRLLVESGRLVGVTGIMRDVTEQRRAEQETRRLQQQLLQAQKMESIGTLAGGIAHDFNNLLQGILGYTSLVLQEVEPGSESHRYLRTILDSAERAANLTRQMLTFSRRREPKIEPIAINQLVEESIRMLRHMIPTTIDIQARLAPDLWTVEADATQIQQVLVNLCVNARDAMPGGGVLRLETTNHVVGQPQGQYQGTVAPGRYVLITVSDTGIGMTPEIQERIFEPFFTTKGVGEGTGLGLAVVYGIVCSHHGWINVQSQPGQGSVFQIYLPASEREVLKQERVTETVPRGRGTILVVDDEPVVLKLACDILAHYGYHTLIAHDGEEAIRVFQERMTEIDLVLLDLTMPKLNGLECARRLRALNSAIPIVASSGYSIYTREKLDGQVAAFVPKPYYPKELAQTVGAILNNT